MKRWGLMSPLKPSKEVRHKTQTPGLVICSRVILFKIRDFLKNFDKAESASSIAPVKTI